MIIIRTQDKKSLELVGENMESICISENNWYAKNTDRLFCIRTFRQMLGEYETEKRAMEILDEIHNHINKIHLENYLAHAAIHCGIANFTATTLIFQMPNE